MGQSLVLAVQHEHVRGTDVVGNALVGQVAEEVRALLDAELARELLPRLEHVAVARDEQLDVLGKLRQRTQDAVDALPHHEAADREQVALARVESEALSRRRATTRDVRGLGPVVCVVDELDLALRHAVALDRNTPQEVAARDQLVAPVPPQSLQPPREPDLPAILLALEGLDVVAVDPALAMADLPSAVDHQADHHLAAREPRRGDVEQSEVLVHVHAVGLARLAEGGPRRLEVAHGQRSALDCHDAERVALWLRIGAERDNRHFVAALHEKAPEARHVDGRAAEVRREDRRSDEDTHRRRRA